MTTDERIENLEKGLASARRFNRWLLAAVGLALGVSLLAGAFGLTMPAAPSGGAAVKEVRANRFVLEDENGKARATLGVEVPGPGLLLLDDVGKPRVMLIASEYGAMLTLNDENAKARAGLTATKDGTGLSLYDENGKPRAGLTTGSKSGALSLYDEGGEMRIMLSAAKNRPCLELYDEKGKARAIVGVTQTTTPDGKTITYPESSFILFGPDGKVIWQAR